MKTKLLGFLIFGLLLFVSGTGSAQALTFYYAGCIYPNLCSEGTMTGSFTLNNTDFNGTAHQIIPNFDIGLSGSFTVIQVGLPGPITFAGSEFELSGGSVEYDSTLAPFSATIVAGDVSPFARIGDRYSIDVGFNPFMVFNYPSPGGEASIEYSGVWSLTPPAERPTTIDVVDAAERSRRAWLHCPWWIEAGQRCYGSPVIQTPDRISERPPRGGLSV